MTLSKIQLDARKVGYQAGYDAAEKLWKRRLRDSERKLTNHINRLQRKLIRIERIISPKPF